MDCAQHRSKEINFARSKLIRRRLQPHSPECGRANPHSGECGYVKDSILTASSIITRLHTSPGPFLLLLVAGVPLPGRAADPGPISKRLREEWKLDPFYQKQVDADLLVVGSKLLTNNALAEAAWIVDRMIGKRPDIIKAMREDKVRIAVMAAAEFTTDVPEHSKLKPKLHCDRQAHGLGATLANPVVSCGEENTCAATDHPEYRAEGVQ